MEIKYIAVDDEPLALEVIEDYAAKSEMLDLVAKCTSGLDALKIIRSKPVDLIFLDIQMPDLSGFELVNSLSNKPMIIFTTAYENYAVESYDFDAVDYLLKPFSFARFMKAIGKVIDRNFIQENDITANKNTIPLNFIFINSNGKIIRLNLDDILYINGMSDYIVVKTAAKKYILRDNLKKVQELLKSSNFVRIHKSYIVPLNKIELIDGSSIKIAGENLPIGRLYRNSLFNMVNQNKIG